MRELPDPQQHFDRSLKRSDEEYAAWLRRGGVEPNDILMREHRPDAFREARDSFVREATEVRDQNVKVILREHRRRVNKLKRQGAKLRMRVCPPIAALFGLLAWYNFTQAGGFVMGIISTVGALAFLAMLVLGAIFDRPGRDDRNG